MVKRGRRRGRETGQEFVSINITPFTDVLLVLLIIFLIAGSSLTRSAVGIERLGTETASTEIPSEADEPVQALRLNAKGELWLIVDGKPSARAELQTLDPGKDWELSADPETRMQYVVDTYDRLLKAGFERVTLVAPPTS